MINDSLDIVMGYKPKAYDFNPAITYKHPFLNRMVYGVELMHIWYDVNELFNEVYKRSSYIGRGAQTKEGVTLIDTIAMTPDEKNTIFRSFVMDAHKVVFENIKPFTHGLRGEVLRYRDWKTGGVIKGEYKEDGDYNVGDVVWVEKGRYDIDGKEVIEKGLYECVQPAVGRHFTDLQFFVHTPTYFIAEYWIKKMDWFNPNAEGMLDNAIHEAIVSYILHKWFVTVAPNLAEVQLAEFNKRMDDILYAANSQDRPMRRKFRLF